MDQSKNYYAILGVLPSAEPVVIRAAYRALALRYHPDTWVGDRAHAEKTMRELNEAYDVLSKEAGRAEYDRNRKKSDFEEYEFENEQTQTAFKNAEDADSSNWDTALEYFPDLPDLYSRLQTTSVRLAFSFRATILETRRFDQRKEVAAELEQKFLQSYFGTNAEILLFAQKLIARGNKAAAKELNRVIKSLGNTIAPGLVIKRIREKFFSEEALAIDRLATKVIHHRHVNDAVALVKMLDGSVKYSEPSIGWFRMNPKITVLYSGLDRTFSTEYKMVEWVADTIAPLYSLPR